MKQRCSLSVDAKFLMALDNKAKDLGISRSRCVERGMADFLGARTEFPDGRWLITQAEIESLTDAYCYECRDPFEAGEDVIMVNGYLHHGICAEG